MISDNYNSRLTTIKIPGSCGGVFSKSELILFSDRDAVIHSHPPALLWRGCGRMAVDNCCSWERDHMY